MSVLVLVVDRDDDLSRKTSFQGPLIGEKTIEKMYTVFKSHQKI